MNKRSAGGLQRRRLGNVHLRGDYVELERVEVTPEMRDLIRRRTDWIVRDYVNFDRPLRLALANAYLAGVNDAVDATNPPAIGQTATGGK